MFAAVSPYHLTTREPPAMAALLFAQRAVTFMPSPRGTREEIEQAAAASPQYVRFMETWAWSMPLWTKGVLGSALDDGDDALGDLHTAWTQLANDERYATLRPLARATLFECQTEFLDVISRDLLRGGPDPGISLPLAAGIDRFAARRGLVVMRSAPLSVAQKAEQKLGRRVFAFAAPMLVQASAERVLAAREILGDELDELTLAMGEVAELIAQGSETPDEHPHERDAVERIEPAARAYADAFARAGEFIAAGGRDELHVISRMATFTAVSLPVDAVLRSGVSAMRSLTNTPNTPITLNTRRASPRSTANTSVETMPVLADALGSKRVLSLVIKPLGERVR
ncbi:MAG: hypothetical protein Q9O74_05865 [Planctomycetota bacterium]|nr:hypothetical protein [Planctomycetota bacterium]